ncbi:MAG TPA: hypothetical protein VF777_14700 [Phycisphaerales bacterium]
MNALVLALSSAGMIYLAPAPEQTAKLDQASCCCGSSCSCDDCNCSCGSGCKDSCDCCCSSGSCCSTASCCK